MKETHALSIWRATIEYPSTTSMCCWRTCTACITCRTRRRMRASYPPFFADVGWKSISRQIRADGGPTAGG